MDKLKRAGSSKSHSGDESDKDNEFDSKLLIQYKALNANDYSLYRKAEDLSVSNLAEVLFAE